MINFTTGYLGKHIIVCVLGSEILSATNGHKDTSDSSPQPDRLNLMSVTDKPSCLSRVRLAILLSLFTLQQQETSSRKTESAKCRYKQHRPQKASQYQLDRLQSSNNRTKSYSLFTPSKTGPPISVILWHPFILGEKESFRNLDCSELTRFLKLPDLNICCDIVKTVPHLLNYRIRFKISPPFQTAQFSW